MEFKTGNFVISKAGHDKGKVYLTVELHQDRILVADGKSHSIEAPKKKNPLHLQPVGTGIDGELLKKLEDKSLRDEEIRKALKNWETSHSVKQ